MGLSIRGSEAHRNQLTEWARAQLVDIEEAKRSVEHDLIATGRDLTFGSAPGRLWILFETSYGIYKRVINAPIEFLGANDLDFIKDSIGKFLDTVSGGIEIRGVQDVFRAVKSHYDDTIVPKILPLLAYLNARRLDGIEDLDRTLKEIHAAAERSVEVLQACEVRLEEIDNRKKLWDEMLTTKGLAENAKFFNTQAGKHRTSARFAWWSAFSLFVAIGVFLYLQMFSEPFTTAPLPARIAVLSSLYAALFWSIRTHRSQMHNYVVNCHRHNALSTYQALAEPMRPDPQMRDIFLIRTAETILSPQASGFQGRAAPDASKGTTVLNTVGKVLDDTAKPLTA